MSATDLEDGKQGRVDAARQAHDVAVARALVLRVLRLTSGVGECHHHTFGSGRWLATDRANHSVRGLFELLKVGVSERLELLLGLVRGGSCDVDFDDLCVAKPLVLRPRIRVVVCRTLEVMISA